MIASSRFPHHSGPHGPDGLMLLGLLLTPVAAGTGALAAWRFGGNGYTDYLLTVVTGVFAATFALTWVSFYLGGATKHLGGAEQHASPVSDWGLRQFDTYAGKVRSSKAAAEILLPLAAVAFGMIAIAIVTRVAG